MSETEARTRTFDHEFERGAYGVCRRCGEEKHPAPGDLPEPPLCSCGSGELREPLIDARGIFCAYVCSACGPDVKRSYRPEIFTNSNYEADEVIEPEDY